MSSNTCKKEPTTKDLINDLDSKINKRPTMWQVITVILTVAGLGMGGLYFMLRNQTDTLAAKTSEVVVTALANHTVEEYRTWEDRKERLEDSILTKVLAKLNLFRK